MGDFNMIPSSMAYRIITSHAPVHDAFRVLHPDSAVGPATHPAERARGRPVPSAAFNLRENGAASDGPFCTWRWPRDAQQRLLAGKPVPPVDPDQPDPRGKRLDYVFAGCGDIDALGGGWVVRRAEVGMTMSHPELRVSLSDHFAVEATLAFHPLKGPDDGSATVSNAEKMPNSATWPASIDSAQDSPNALQLPRHGSTDMNSTKSTGQDAEMRKGIFLQSPAPSSPAQRDSFSAEYPAAADRPSSSPEQQLACFASPRQDTHYMPPAAYAEVLAEIHWYQARERAQERWRGRHFLAWAVVAVVCHVAVWWSPHNGVAFVLMLLSTLGFVAGTVDGLLSLLFFRWELRTLREFEWEIRNAMAVAGGELKAIRALQDESGQDSY